MNQRPTILSTKILNTSQRSLLHADINIIEEDFIKIDVQPTKATYSSHAIVSSQNAARIIIENNINIDYTYCVGAKTAQILSNAAYQVRLVDKNSETLGRLIANQYPNEEFDFYCGNKRLDILPNILQSHGIKLREYIIYKTSLTPKEYKNNFDGILFFSPSAVESFLQINKAIGIAFCIGHTTAEAAKSFDQVLIAKKTTIEEVITQAINYLKI